MSMSATRRSYLLFILVCGLDILLHTTKFSYKINGKNYISIKNALDWFEIELFEKKSSCFVLIINLFVLNIIKVWNNNREIQFLQMICFDVLNKPRRI